MAKWFLRDEEHLEHADRILDRHQIGEEPLTAPNFLRYELANTLLRAIRSRRIDEEYGVRAASRFAGLNIVQQADPDGRLLSASDLAYGMGISFCDALYVALSQELEVPVVTADVDLYERVGRFLSTSIALLPDVTPL